MDADNNSSPRSRRRVAVWMSVVVIAALLPVLAQAPVLARFSTALWLASMPLCLLGCAMLAKEATARWASGQDRD